MSAPLAYLLSQKPSSKVKPIHLKHPKMVMGRNIKADIPVFSVNVSREHALLTQDDNGVWAIEDLKSLNGVFVNECQVPKGHKRMLVEGDVISLGPPELTKFAYTFHCAESPKRTSEDTLPPIVPIPCEPLPDQEDSVHPSRDTSQNSSLDGSLFTKDKLQEADELIRQLSDSILTNIERHLSNSPAPHSSKGEPHHVTAPLSSTLEPPSVAAPAAPSASSSTFLSTTFPLSEPTSEHSSSLVAPLDSKPPTAIAIDVPEVAEEVQIVGIIMPPSHTIDNSSPIQDHPMREVSNIQKENVPSSSEQLPEAASSSKGGAAALPSEDLEEIEKKAAFKGESLAMERVGSVMENEFTCAICTELFVQATTLNCSHTFCKYCIEQWSKAKSECPICRTRITARTHSLVLDNFINKMTETLSKEAKLHRQELVKERQKTQVSKSPSKNKVQARRERGRGRYNTRSRQNEPSDHALEVVDLSSDSDMSLELDSDEYSESEYYENYGRHNAYYGGYGHCFNCGRPGHWRSGCPYLYM